MLDHMQPAMLTTMFAFLFENCTLERPRRFYAIDSSTNLYMMLYPECEAAFNC
jgi:hypothetical protein